MNDVAGSGLENINFFTTYGCNSRCLNCCIWQEQSAAERGAPMDASQLHRLFDDPLFESCHQVGLAGGEPTIAPFFWQLLDLLPADKNITITTNALSSRRLITYLQTCPHPEKYRVQVSVDGLGPVHDKIRGVNGSFDKAIQLLESLTALHIDCLVSYTINRLNYSQLADCYRLAQELGARFSTRMAHCGGAYDNKTNRELFAFNPDELRVVDGALNTIIEAELEKASCSPAQLVFLSHITDYFRGKQENLPCLAMETGLVIDLHGDVFPNCPAMMTSLGSLGNDTLSDIWSGDKALKARRMIVNHQCGGCWNDCQVVTNIEHHRDFRDKEFMRLKRDWLQGRAFRETIDFSRNQTAYILAGWYAPEGDETFGYCWTEPQFSFFVPAGTTRIEMFAMIPGGPSGKRVQTQLILDNQCVENEIIGDSGWKNYHIDFSKPTNEISKCRLRLDPYCPQEAGDGHDIRTLGMAVNKISFSNKRMG